MTVIVGKTAQMKTWELVGAEYKYTLSPVESLLFHLGDRVEVADGATFGDVLRCIIEDPNSAMLDLVFRSETQIANTLHNLGVVLAMTPSEIPVVNVDGVELLPPGIDITRWDGGPVEVGTMWSLNGVCDANEDYYGVEFSPVCDFKDLPFHLNMEEKVVRFDRKRHKEETLEVIERECTVFDFYRSILYDITMCGIVRPGDKIEANEAMKQPEKNT